MVGRRRGGLRGAGGTVCDGIDPRVRHFAIDGAEASFVYGKHSYGLIDVESGEVSYWGSD